MYKKFGVEIAHFFQTLMICSILILNIFLSPTFTSSENGHQNLRDTTTHGEDSGISAFEKGKLFYTQNLVALLRSAQDSSLRISNISEINTVGKYEKQEITFDIATSVSNPQLPYDSDPPTGITNIDGISVDGIFTSPTGKVWSQPGFYYQIFEDQLKDGDQNQATLKKMPIQPSITSSIPP